MNAFVTKVVTILWVLSIASATALSTRVTLPTTTGQATTILTRQIKGDEEFAQLKGDEGSVLIPYNTLAFAYLIIY